MENVTTSSPLPTTEKLRVLLAEDNEISRLQIENVLRESGFEVDSVPDGRCAVDAVANSPEGHYSAVLMDILMPVMDGYEATKAIRALNRTDVFSLPIIALTSKAQLNDKIQSFASGFNEHLIKPFDVDELTATLHKHLSKEKGPCR
ncbi:MAG: response regulator [Desulfovibrio sp.]|nr:response regulator [Desulfovibrio sp.]